MRLTKLKIGQRAIVTKVISLEIASKLTELGVIQGQEIQPLFKAPFGGPTAFQVGSYVLALRPSESNVVEVEMLDEIR